MYLNDKVPSAAAENEELLSRLRTIIRKLLYCYELFSYQLVNRRPYRITFTYKPPSVMKHRRFSCALDKVFSSQDSYMHTCRIGCNLELKWYFHPSFSFIFVCGKLRNRLKRSLLYIVTRRKDLL